MKRTNWNGSVIKLVNQNRTIGCGIGNASRWKVRRRN